MSAVSESGTNGHGTIVFAYDGSPLAKGAIAEAGRLLGAGREARVLTLWQPFDLGFIPSDGDDLDAADPAQVKRAAERTAAEGAVLAETAGFHAQGTALESSPPWKAIVGFADEQDAALIVLGSHGRKRLLDAVIGSVAGDVAAHARRSVLIVHAHA